MESVYIAADLGASGGKMCKGYIEEDKIIVDDYFDFPNRPVSLNGNLYWDLFSLYRSILEGAARYARDSRAVSIGIDTWGASYGFLDRKGRLLEPIYHYRDLRTEHSLENMYRVLPPQELFRLTGCQPARSYTLPQLYSYREHGEAITDLADRLLFLPDLLEYFLSGDASTERSIAGTSGMMRPEQDGWALEAMDKLGIPTGFLTKLTDPGRIRGRVLPEVAEVTGLRDTNVVSVVGHDTASAVVAIPGFGVNQVYIGMGTGINMGVELTHSVTSEKAFRGGFKNASIIENRKMLYRDFGAFWMLNEFIRTCHLEGRDYTYPQLMELAGATPSGRMYVDPDDPRLFDAGGNAREKIADYLKATGQPLPESDGECVRCILESIALKIRYVVEYLKNELEIPVCRICVVNGGSRNYVLMQMIADALGMEVEAGMPYATLAGNVLTQMYAAGEFTSVDQIREVSRRSFGMRTFRPSAQQKPRWDADYEIMCEKGICK